MIQRQLCAQIQHRGHQERVLGTKPRRIVVADDDDEVRGLLVRTLREQEYDVTELTDGAGLLDYLDRIAWRGEREQIDLIISANRLPGVTGFELLGDLNQWSRRPRVILMTLLGDEMTVVEAQRLGATAVFEKPFSLNDLLAVVHAVAPN